jgi:hypothetical protein
MFGDKTDKKDVAPGVKAFRDGYAVELNVPPAEDVLTLAKHVRAGILGVTKLLPEGHRLVATPTVSIDLKADLKDAPEDVLHFGCDPSFDAYTGKEKCPRVNAWEHPYRYAGGHMHFSATAREIEKGTFGWLKKKDNHLLFIRMMDYRVGVPLTIINHGPAQFLRRKVYGQAGEFRPQEYPDGSLGLEYRTPCPSVWNNLAVATFAFETGMEMFRHFYLYAKVWNDKHEKKLQAALNHGEGLQEILPPEQANRTEQLCSPNHRAFTLPMEVMPG